MTRLPPFPLSEEEPALRTPPLYTAHGVVWLGEKRLGGPRLARRQCSTPGPGPFAVPQGIGGPWWLVMRRGWLGQPPNFPATPRMRLCPPAAVITRDGWGRNPSRRTAIQDRSAGQLFRLDGSTQPFPGCPFPRMVTRPPSFLSALDPARAFFSLARGPSLCHSAWELRPSSLGFPFSAN